MSLASRFAKADQERAITCAKYQAIPNSKRCVHYQDGGTCSLPDEFLCIEWQKANAGRIPGSPITPPPASAPSVRPVDSADPRSLDHDLLGHPLPPQKPKEVAPREESARSETTPPVGKLGELTEPVLIRGLTDADIASFKALNVEVCIRNESIGEVWLVPEYTGQDRKEISCEDAAFLTAVVAAFPGAKVTSFDKRPEPQKQESKPSRSRIRICPIPASPSTSSARWRSSSAMWTDTHREATPQPYSEKPSTGRWRPCSTKSSSRNTTVPSPRSRR